MINQNPKICFEFDCSHKFIEEENACSYTMEYESVIRTGETYFCEKSDEKIFALSKIMQTYSNNKNFIFDEKSLSQVSVFKAEVEDISGKRLVKR